MERTIVLFIISALGFLIAPAQKDTIPKNQYNEQGKKEGYWVVYNEPIKTEGYYRNGIRTGIIKEYHYGRLFCVGEYKAGEMAGTWYYFGDEGELRMIFTDFKLNTDSVTNTYGVKYVPKYSCRFISYHPNGIIEDDGILLWREKDHPISDSFEHGKWRYYDEKGNLVRTKIYE